MKRVFVNRVMNKTIMTGAPIREIAIMFDKKIPEFISDIVSIVDRSSKVELMSWIGFDMIGKWDEDYYNENKHDLLVYLAAEIFEMTDFVQKEGYAQYDDYLIYIFFFTQYRKLTGKNLRKDMSFESILLEYQKIDNENLWKTFVYSDDPEGDRTYTLFLYDDYKLDFYEVTTHFSYIDEELADRFSELMHSSFCDDSISHIRKFNLVKYMSPEFAAFLDDLDVCYFTEGEGISFSPSVPDDMINDSDAPPFVDESSDSFMEIPDKIEDCKLPFDDTFSDFVSDDLPFGADMPKSICTPKEMVEEYVIDRISGFIYYCVGKLYKISDDKDKINEIDKLDEDIQNLYGDVKWFDFDRKIWIKAYVPEYLTKEEFQTLVDEKKKSDSMIPIYNYLFGLGQTEYIVKLVDYLKKNFSFVLEDVMIPVDSEEVAVEELFMLTDRLNAYFFPVFEVIAKEKDKLKLVSIKDPYNVRHQLDAAEELRLEIGLPPSDAWLLQEQIYLCAYRFEELCMILHLLVVTLEMSKDKDKAKRIANEYRYLFKNITNHIFQDFLATDVFVENKKYNKKIDKDNSSVTGTSNILVNNLLLALDKMLQTDNMVELSESKGMIINSLRILGGNDELIESVILKLENALVEKCKVKSGFSEIYNRVQQEMKYFPVSISDTTINTLSTAEYFYKEYILDMPERETFDYSCFSILYFQVLESALNELLYLPYKLRYETEIIERANSNAGKVDDCYCVPAKVSGMIKRKNGKYCMSEQLTLGGLAFFCLGMDYNPDKKDLVKFVRDVFKDPEFNVKKLVSFGKELMEISKRRNVAAHASENLSADSFIESKDCVFNKTLTMELRNMLWRFLEFFK